MRFGYFGPQGTFTEQALLQLPQAKAPDAVRLAYGSVDATLAAVRTGAVDQGVVPIENSVEGGVSATLDALANGDPLIVLAEMLVPITFVLAARPGTTLADIGAVGTHSHAWAQVRGWMDAHLPDAVYVPTLSTASGAAGLGAEVEGGEVAPYQAAVCAPIAASTYGLDVLAEDIKDRNDAVTRFVLVARPSELPAPTGADKTTLVLFQHSDHPGGLLALLEQFAARGINMTRLESRPTGQGMGSYCFSIDIEGHVTDERVGEALMGLKRICEDVRFLGSYPRADRRAAQIADRAYDEDFRSAREWLHGLRDLA